MKTFLLVYLSTIRTLFSSHKILHNFSKQKLNNPIRSLLLSYLLCYFIFNTFSGCCVFFCFALSVSVDFLTFFFVVFYLVTHTFFVLILENFFFFTRQIGLNCIKRKAVTSTLYNKVWKCESVGIWKVWWFLLCLFFLKCWLFIKSKIT